MGVGLGDEVRDEIGHGKGKELELPCRGVRVQAHALSP